MDPSWKRTGIAWWGSSCVVFDDMSITIFNSSSVDNTGCCKIKPSLSLIASIWPETYCHTLTESWALGIPVLVSPLGALRERVENNGGGWFFDPSRVESILETVQTIRDNPDQWWSRRNEIEIIPSRSTRDMSREYVRIYKRLVGLPLKEKTLCLERASRNQQGQDITEQTVSNNTNQNVSRFGTKGHHLKSRGLKRV